MKLHAILAAGLFALTPVLPAVAAPITFDAVLSGAAEAPPNLSGATGVALVTIDETLHTLLVEVQFEGLTSPNIAAHIHCCVAPNGTAVVATVTPTFTGFPSGTTSGTYSHLFDTLLASTYRAGYLAFYGGIVADAEEALFDGIEAGEAYLNIHTTIFTGGEIRGFLEPCGGATGNACETVAVPEPATLALLGLGLAGLGFSRRRTLS